MDKSFNELIDIIKKLRGENGCAWDKVQTFDSLIPCFIEEAYELIEGINNRDFENIKEELGDVLLLIVFFSELANDDNKFNIKDVINNLNEKLIRRHPHVFGDKKLNNINDILKQWEEIKKEEKGNIEFKSILDNIPKSLPIFEKSYKLMKKASSVGFEYANTYDAFNKINEELKEVEEAYKENNKEHLEEEIGDLFMTIIEFSRINKINPINSLLKANNKFKNRFQYIEKKAIEQNKTFKELSLEDMDNLWQEYKNNFEKK